MYKTLLLISLIPFLVSAQAVDETFDSFVNVIDDSTYGYWVFDSLYANEVSQDSMIEDLTTNNSDLTTIVGWSDYGDVVDSCITNSPLYSGGKVLHFSGSNYFTRADDTNFDIEGGEDFSVDFWIRVPPVDGQNHGVIGKNPGTDFWLILLVDVTGRLNCYLYTTGDNELPYLISENRIDSWNHYCVVYDRSANAIIYKNGVSQSVTQPDLSPSADSSVANAANLGVGAYGDGTSAMRGSIASLAFTRRVLTAAEARERWALANGWYSIAGKVTRESTTTFHQGFYDGETVFYPIANATGSYSLTFDAKGTKSGDVVTVNVGSQTGVAQTLTASLAEYTLNLGYEVASADSLYFVASAGDTIYIDDVVLTLGGGDIYLDNDGSDSNPGSSVTTPIQTIAAVNAATIAPSATVYLRTADTWRETLTQPSSGTSGNPITITCYDSATGLTGAAALALGDTATISGADLVSTWTLPIPSPTALVDLEEGDLSDWDATGTDGGDLSATTTSALAQTSYGMRVLIDDQTEIYGEKTFAWDTTGQTPLRIRFYFNPNGIQATSGETDHMVIANFENPSDRAWVGFFMEDNTTAYTIKAGIRDDGTVSRETSYYAITNASHLIEVEYIRASSNSASDGTVKLWIDGVLKETKSSIDVYDLSLPTDIRLGAPISINGIDAGTLGTMYFDQMILNVAGDLIGAHGLYQATLAGSDSAQAISEDGTRLTESTSILTIVAPGSFYHDAGNNLIYARCTDSNDPDTHTMDAFQRQFCITMTNKSYITIDGLHLKNTQWSGSEWGRGAGIRIRVDNTAGTYQGWTIQNCTFEDHVSTSIYGNIGTGSNSRTITGLTISNNTITEANWGRGAGVSMIWLHGDFTNGYGWQNVTIDNNTMYQDITINPDNDGDPSTNGMTLEIQGGTNVINNNEIEGVSHGIVVRGLDSSGTYATIKYNDIHDTSDDGVWVKNNIDSVEIYYNLIYNTLDNGIDTYKENASDSSFYVDIYNNVIYNVTGPSMDITRVQNATIKNNVMLECDDNTNRYGIMIDDGASDITLANIDSDYNQFYHSSGAIQISIASASVTATRSLATWRSNEGQDLNSNENDPLFTDAANNDFTLQSSSPCIDAGTSVELTLDYLGNTVPFGSAPDIGAYEYSEDEEKGFETFLRFDVFIK